MSSDAVKMTGNGRDLWYRRGVSDLMLVLIGFQPHPLDRRQENRRFDEAVQETAQHSDTALSVVAEQL